jgi:uncharacterized membrane protein
MAFCSTCGVQIPDGTITCAACAGRAAAAPAPPPAPAATGAPAGAMADNVAGLLAYITIIPAIVFLVVEPYNRNRFIRFHAFQNIFLHVAAIAIWIVLMILTLVASIIPIIGHILVALLGFAIWIGFLVLWIVLLIKAYGGQMFKLPFIGDLAEKQANAI